MRCWGIVFSSAKMRTQEKLPAISVLLDLFYSHSQRQLSSSTLTSIVYKGNAAIVNAGKQSRQEIEECLKKLKP